MLEDGRPERRSIPTSRSKLSSARPRVGILAFRGQRSLVPEKRHIVHCGRRVGTLTRNGGQWVFRFATSMTDDVVHAVADRLSSLVGELEESRIADLGSHQHLEEGRSRKSGGGSQASNMALE